MTLGRRQHAVARAERRASERIRRAGATTSSLRADQADSTLPATVVGCGVALGLGLSWLTVARARTPPSGPTVPPAGALTSLGVLLRAAQQLAPLIQAPAGKAAASKAPDSNAPPDASVASAADGAEVATGAADPSAARQAEMPAVAEVDRD